MRPTSRSPRRPTCSPSTGSAPRRWSTPPARSSGCCATRTSCLRGPPAPPDDDRDPPGIDFTLPGQVARYDEELKKAASSTVGEVMEKEFQHVGPDATLEDVATLMHEHDVTHVPVVVDGKVRRHRRPRRHRPLPRRHHVTGTDDRAVPRRVGRDRPRRGPRQRRARSSTSRRPPRCMAVVKADGYGHGAVPVARAALEAGATWLGVALVEEGVELREAGIDAPILVLSEPSPEAAAGGRRPPAHARRLHDGRHRRAGEGGRRSGRGEPLAVHLKVDTGMHRVGARARRRGRARPAGRRPHASCASGACCTHFAVADEPDDPYTDEQLARFRAVLADLDAAGLRPAARARGELGRAARVPRRALRPRAGRASRSTASRRCPELAGPRRAAARAVAARRGVSHVKTLDAGARVSYGLRYRARARRADRDRADRLRRRRAAQPRRGRRRGRGRRARVARSRAR